MEINGKLLVAKLKGTTLSFLSFIDCWFSLEGSYITVFLNIRRASETINRKIMIITFKSTRIKDAMLR